MRVFLFVALTLSAGSVMAEEQRALIVYGNDNRQDLSDVSDQRVRELGKSIAGRVTNHSFKRDITNNSVSFDHVSRLSDPYSMKVCSDERFANQFTAAECTGFLVGEDLLVTAGHCMVGPGESVRNGHSRDCSANSWVFDYTKEADLKNMSSDNVYGCKKIIAAELTEDQDYALIQLDRKVTNRKPLKLAKKKISLGQKIFVMGHPSGLPLKFADGARVFGVENTFFSTNLDTFGGNSGSPVFNSNTLEVSGILVRGDIDYILSREANGERCTRVNTCDQERGNCLEDEPSIDGEHVNHINIINSSL